MASPSALSLARLRAELGRNWLIALFGVAYAISQITILVIIEPLGSSLAKLQLLGFSAAEYLTVFRHWEETGAMSAYRAHFIFDDTHWLLYAGFFTAVLCRLFEIHRVPQRWNWVLVLPIVSGLLDHLENGLQHVFLSAHDFSTIVDPLPWISTLASDLKWLVVATYALLSLVLVIRVPVVKRRYAARSPDESAY